jgi:hypothetical protein
MLYIFVFFNIVKKTKQGHYEVTGVYTIRCSLGNKNTGNQIIFYFGNSNTHKTDFLKSFVTQNAMKTFTSISCNHKKLSNDNKVTAIINK